MEAAARELGGAVIDKKTYEWYGQSVGGYPIPTGMTAEQIGRCEFAIKFPGIRYEVGICKRADGAYVLGFDFYGSDGRHDGLKLKEKVGDNLNKLRQAFSKHKTLLALRRQGFTVRQAQQTDGKIRITALPRHQ